MNARRALRMARVPDEPGAEARAWAVVRAAYAERQPAQPKARWRTALVPAIVLAIGAAALSPAGATVRRWISHTLGIAHPAPALFSLPAAGRVLVSGPGGTWIVTADGSTRHLGPWTQAGWSPHGEFVIVAGGDHLAAVDPKGNTRWSLARPAVHDPSWYAPTGYRVAYLSGSQLRVVAGDGTGDHLLAPDVASVTAAWRPGHPYELAYLDRAGRIVVRDADTGADAWTVKPRTEPDALAWSSDGGELLAVGHTGAFVYGGGGRLLATIAPGGATIGAGSISPDGHAVALVLAGATTDVAVAHLSGSRPRLERVLSGAGLRQVAWSPDDRWLLVSWPAADQWVFVRVAGKPRIAATSRIAQQFGDRGVSRGFPVLDGWCCTAQGAAG